MVSSRNERSTALYRVSVPPARSQSKPRSLRIGTASDRMISLSVGLNRSARLTGGGAGSLSGMSKIKPSGKTPDACRKTASPFRTASSSRERLNSPHGFRRRLALRNHSESSKYRLCVWKWCGPRCIPSDQTTRDRNFIGRNLSDANLSEAHGLPLRGLNPTENLHEDYRRTAVRDGREICECRKIKHVSVQTNLFDCSGIVGILLMTVKLVMRLHSDVQAAHNRLPAQEIK